MQTHSRPMGPRSFRSASPAPPVNLPETAPLNIRKPRLPDSLSPPRLVIPKPSSPKPAIRVSIPPPNGSDNSNSGDSPTYIYYGGPRPSSDTKALYGLDEKTIRPAPSVDTTRPALTQKPSEPIEEVHTLLTNLKIRTTPSSGSDFQPEDDAIPAQKLPSLPWSDDVLEQIASLGEGAGGAVHRVKDKRTGKIMARKTITTRGAPMKQLLRELSIISSTEHINIILFHGAYISPSSSEVKILMELCEGGSLEAIGKRIKERDAVVGEKIAGRIAEGVLQGLAYLHRKKTIHRDIKPSNILLSREGIVKLCDFGVSGELIDSMAGTFTGTSMYMAPERICGHEYTIRSDVWSTGISLLELVQNRFPFPNDLPPIELMMYITTGEPPRLEDGGGLQWSDDMKDFIKETLTVDAMARPKPQDMLEHPWIVGVMKQEVHMARWIRQVWGWPKSSRRSRDQTNSRPSSSQRTDSSGGSPGGLDSSSNTSST